jgi:hypothetical protein
VDLRAWGNAEGGAGAMNNLQPLWLLKYLPNMPACHVTIIHGTEGPSNTITCAEASGLLSIGESVRVIRRNDADLCFSGGAESPLNHQRMIRMQMAGRLAETGDEDRGLCQTLRPRGSGAGPRRGRRDSDPRGTVCLSRPRGLTLRRNHWLRRRALAGVARELDRRRGSTRTSTRDSSSQSRMPWRMRV